jgi:hypothetical protein
MITQTTMSREQDLLVRAVYHQRCPRTADGGRTVLFECPYCGRLWVRNGHGEAFALFTAMQQVHYTRLLEAEIGAWDFPQAICGRCSLTLGGRYSVEEYFTHDGPVSTSHGFRFLWWGFAIEAPGAHLSCSVYRLGGERGALALQDDWTAVVQAAELDVVTSPASCIEAVIAWFKTLDNPPSPFPSLACEQPGEESFADDFTHLAWRGWSWIAWCPPLGGSALVSVEVRQPADKPTCSPDVLLRLWSSRMPSSTGPMLRRVLCLPL